MSSDCWSFNSASLGWNLYFQKFSRRSVREPTWEQRPREPTAPGDRRAGRAGGARCRAEPGHARSHWPQVGPHPARQVVRPAPRHWAAAAGSPGDWPRWRPRLALIGRRCHRPRPGTARPADWPPAGPRVGHVRTPPAPARPDAGLRARAPRARPPAAPPPLPAPPAAKFLELDPCPSVRAPRAPFRVPPSAPPAARLGRWGPAPWPECPGRGADGDRRSAQCPAGRAPRWTGAAAAAASA